MKLRLLSCRVAEKINVLHLLALKFPHALKELQCGCKWASREALMDAFDSFLHLSVAAPVQARLESVGVQDLSKVKPS